MISPVYLQGSIQNSQDFSNIKQNENTRPQTEHAMINMRQQDREIKKHEQVNHKDNADNASRKYDAKEKGNNEYHGQSKDRKKKESESDGRVVVKKKSSFDIKA